MDDWLTLTKTKLHSGRESIFKIDCDHLTDDEVEAGCALLAKFLPSFGAVSGVPTGGLRMEQAMKKHLTDSSVRLIVDDVWTTGRSVNNFIAANFPHEHCITGVFFARGIMPNDAWALFHLTPRLWRV